MPPDGDRQPQGDGSMGSRPCPGVPTTVRSQGPIMSPAVMSPAVMSRPAMRRGGGSNI